MVSLANATQWNQNLLKMHHALIKNSWQLILGKVSKGFDLSWKCWYNQNRCQQRMQASQKSSSNYFLSHDLKESKEKFLFFNKKRSGWMFFFLSLSRKWLNMIRQQEGLQCKQRTSCRKHAGSVAKFTATNPWPYEQWTHTIKVTKELLASFKSARLRHGIALEEKRERKPNLKGSWNENKLKVILLMSSPKRRGYCKPLNNCQKLQIIQ